jgi:hypothetical protein
MVNESLCLRFNVHTQRQAKYENVGKVVLTTRILKETEENLLLLKYLLVEIFS